MYLALAGPPLPGRRFLLVQDNEILWRAANYYELEAPDRSTAWRTEDRVAWRDYYYAAVYVLLTEAAGVAALAGCRIRPPDWSRMATGTRGVDARCAGSCV